MVQLTTHHQRLWNWLGSVVHWLYPTLLRQYTDVWYQLVIWLAIAGIFLTATGLYLGIKQYKTRRNGRLSPYRGIALWHHYTGLIFGILILTWVVSGLLSMNPWGLLEGDGDSGERNRLSGGAIGLSEMAHLTTRLSDYPLAGNIVRLEGYVDEGELAILSHKRDGSYDRLNATSLREEPLTDTYLFTAARPN